MERPVSRLSSRPKHWSHGDISSFSSCFHDPSAFDGLGTRPTSRQHSRRASQNNSVSFARRGSDNGDAVGAAKAAAAPLSPLPKAECSTPQPMTQALSSPTPIRKCTILPALPHQASPPGEANTMNLELKPRLSRTVSSPGTSLGFSPLQIPALSCPVPPKVCGGPEPSEHGILPSVPLPARRSSTGNGLTGKLSSPDTSPVGRPLLPTCRSNL
ncbi:hypothetical protein DUNSADRAFT_7132 [Dunaliella salina]|uniref:Encoded protein n=1 Tax=Dunaliella salina TaxID=3046 RepID=A0ABQ7GLZ1_DUNSA|nr:hypothetical protein DUNSADRAFT_7132 [Dunaliella salina]|eukprot:KAF5835630.1 hypothetical protein DUNSADRAFT_7132 [Dunaliella salina]